MKPRERLLKIITSIVLTTIVFILVVTFVGVGLVNSFSENGAQLPNMGAPVISDPSMLGNDDTGNDISEESYVEIELTVSKNNDVPEAELAADWCIDTVPGLITVKYEIPDELPLCITEEYLDSNLKIIVKTYGGYEPEDGGLNSLFIWQPKTKKGGLVGIDWIDKGPIPYDSDPICPPLSGACELDVFWADFVLLEPIQVDSNHLPEVLVYGDADWTTLCDGTPSDNLDKWVFMSFVSSWEGCDEYDQKFKLILAHKNYFSESPTST